MNAQSDTIAALSTPRGPGAIGILRLSGPEAVEVAQRCFRPEDGRPLRSHPPRTLVYGRLLDRGGEVIDRVLCTFSPGPGSYTGEDTAELHCHGSPCVLSLGLEALFAAGARQARAGEFTRRAFLNGKMDLTQAEAVGDLLEATSRESVRNAAGQLSGALSGRIGEIYSALTDVMAHFYAVLDYPDEDIDPFRMDTLLSALTRQEEELDSLLASCRRGRLLTGGIACVIAGRPNAGKSSLLNALAGYERAIVTDIPGTTRDTVEVAVELEGLPFRLIDTAGLRESADPIERLGTRRSRQAMEEADLILVVWDSSAGVEEEDRELLRQAMALAPVILVWSKEDLAEGTSPDLSFLPEPPPLVALSARTGEGLAQLERLAAGLFAGDGERGYGRVLTNARQEEAATRALAAVRRAREALLAGMTPDALLTDVEEAMAALGELTGRSVAEDVTERIFARFCVGK